MNNKKETSQDGFNWGKGLTIAITLFVCATLGMVAYIISLDYHMVTEHHYEKAVNYQQHIDRLEQTSTLIKPVKIELVNRQIQIRFPSSLSKSNLSGSVELYRPSNPALDQTVTLSLNDKGIQNLAMSEKAKGKWLVKVSWSANGKKYYKQQAIFL